MIQIPSKTKVVIIGGGQAGLAVGYFLRRTDLGFVILDNQVEPGGAWLHAWRSLQLFSPGDYSSLPGWGFPKTKKSYPEREEVIEYLREYEKRYDFPVKRSVSVQSVTRMSSGLLIETNHGSIEASTVVSCTGTWGNPYIPSYPSKNEFLGTQIHSAQYCVPTDFISKKVLIVGGGNSGAQIFAEVSRVTDATWVTERDPKFLPDDVDGRVLFQVATQRYQARLEGRSDKAIPSLGDIVMVDSVKEARSRGILKPKRPFSKFTNSGVVWSNGTEETFDVIIWCTGFRPALEHLKTLGIENADEQIEMNGTRTVSEPRLWLVGYGEWTGFGSATLIGVQRYARSTVVEIQDYLGSMR
ncbi:MAG: ArsO family NAD(P)H-dependent flavin-containing monooxygenase [Gammaproteobacteria bacterium]|nr:ArsO family NAD(P)H-dependent flavin-containing monooxygenase [Gammaproteobacteria bacterium]